MVNDIYFWLQFSALIFFNLLCIMGIIAVFVVISTINKIKDKTEEVMDSVKSATSNIGETAEGVYNFLSPFFRPKRIGMMEAIARILGR